MGMVINTDVKREEIEGIVREMMEGEEGKKMKKKTLEWGKMAENATKEGGSSYSNFYKMIKEFLLAKTSS
ncbi:hypothetical protein GIB67_031365 [Kingdonia uniflora]|uniref:Uncharacterized protein n=1 Tax=Kingdonia uniflora TaxID=39325 RepID=A0A7J7MAY0_9MAGN|nr:hypothetical protein GIB67_031365 [Kingdonia uniflora]